MTRGRSLTVLDRAMPEWTWSEYHSLRVPPHHANVIESAEALQWSDAPLFRQIMRTVSLGRVPADSRNRVLELFTDGPYLRVHRDAEELVYAGLLRPRDHAAPRPFEGDPLADFRRAAPPRTVKVAMNFLYRDGVLSTETRCQATDVFADRAFALYWFAIRAGSGLIRRSWLRGIRRRSRRSDAQRPGT